MPLIKEPDTEPIAGYRLVEILGQGGFGEVWKCEAPGGVFKAIKFVRGNLKGLDVERLQAEQEWKALQLVKTIRHPFLLGIDRLEVVGGELLVVMELADCSLADALRSCRLSGLPGIPRAELLSYLREAAEALDIINLQHHLQHLDVKPPNLFLVNRHVKVGDFGLLSRLCDGTEHTIDAALGGLTPLYCAPETLGGVVSATSDQYSLAVVYQELLTGQLPFTGRNARELMMRRLAGEPDLSSLPAAERPTVARAMARDPEARYPSCTEFVRALAPELMPPNSSPFLDELLSDGAAAPSRPRGNTHVDLTHPTLTVPNDNTVPRPAAARRPPEPPPADDVPDFAGHRLLKCLGRSPLGETWKVQAPDGRNRLLKFPNGLTDGSDPAEVETVRFLSTAVHPNLLPVEVIGTGTGRVALICDLREGTLSDRLLHCQTVGLPGIPRRELLDHLHTAAAALDFLYREHGLQHLCLSPRAFVLDGKEVLLADMGLGQLLWLPGGQPLGQLNGRYAAPELCAGEVSPTCDQYSLAVLFQELLTGTSPFRGPARGKARPNLDLLPAPDREPIARALNPNPERRFATCSELIEALERRATAPARRASVLLPPVIPIPGPAGTLDGPLPQPRALIGQILERAAGRLRPQRADSLCYLLEPGALLTHTCAAYLSASLARLKLEGFCQQWNAGLVAGDADGFVLEVPLAGSLWQRWVGRQPALAIDLRLDSSKGTTQGLTAIRVEVRPVRCRPEQAAAVLEQHGLSLLRSLRRFLQVEPERRAAERLPFETALGVFSVLDDQQLGDALVCQGKDLSAGGVAFLAPQAPPAGQVYVQTLLTPQLSAVALLGRVVRVRPLADGRHEVGVVFAEGPETFLGPGADLPIGPRDR